MVVTPDTVITGVDPFDISEEKFAEVMRTAGSPAAASSHDAYMILGTFPVSIAAMLAVFHHESTYATNPAAIVVKHDTKNPGNCRSTRTGVGTVISTARGPFVKYPSWTEGWRDLSWRLVDPTYAYVKEGRTTIRQIIERFAPASDNNSPNSYIAAVVKDMNAWAESEPPMTGDDSRFTWRPDTSEFGYPQGTRGRNGFAIELGIVHYTAGTNSSGWLLGENGSSTHYLTDQQMRPFEQHVREADAAWTAGNREYNLRGINVEAEMPGNRWTDARIREFAKTTYPIWKRNNIPLVYIGRDSGRGKRGLIGHVDVPDQDHTDPGSTFSWPLYIAELRKLDGEVQPPADDRILVEGNPFGPFGYALGFKGRLQQIGAAVNPTNVDQGILAWAGWAMESERQGVDGCVYQRTERLILKYTPNVAVPFDVTPMLRSETPPERKP